MVTMSWHQFHGNWPLELLSSRLSAVCPCILSLEKPYLQKNQDHLYEFLYKMKMLINFSTKNLSEGLVLLEPCCLVLVRKSLLLEQGPHEVAGLRMQPRQYAFRHFPSTASLFIVENTPTLLRSSKLHKTLRQVPFTFYLHMYLWKYLGCWHVHSEKVWSPSHPILPLDLTPILSSPCLHLFHLGKGLSRKNAWIVRSDWPYGHHPFLGFVFKISFQTGSRLTPVRQTVTKVVEAHCEIAFPVHVGNIQNSAGPQDLWVKNPSCVQFLIVWGYPLWVALHFQVVLNEAFKMPK